jgi:hypothetical protein
MHYVTNFESRLKAEGTYRHRLNLGIKYLYMNTIRLISVIIQETGCYTKQKKKFIWYLWLSRKLALLHTKKSFDISDCPGNWLLHKTKKKFIWYLWLSRKLALLHKTKLIWYIWLFRKLAVTQNKKNSFGICDYQETGSVTHKKIIWYLWLSRKLALLHKAKYKQVNYIQHRNPQ